MSPDRRNQIGLLYQAAIELPPEDRAEFLKARCGTDLVLYQEVESLLVAHPGTDTFLAQAAKSGLPIGKVIAHYKVLKPLGSGGMGEVYLAEDTRLKRQVAIKFLPRDFAADSARLRRFEQEARATSALNHPSILTIHEIGEVDSTRFIVTEFIDGVTLRQRIAQGHLDLLEALDVAIQVASALVAAHKVRIVHRDIKPENIMLRRDDRLVKVLDFGLAKATERSAANEGSGLEAPTRAMTNTAPGTVMGTVSYMSPEQARGESVDERSDIWSLGVVIYELIAGTVPFPGSGANEVVANILSRDEAAPLARFSHSVPAELERIVSKALRKECDQRYQTIKDFMLDLQSLKKQVEFELKLQSSQPADVVTRQEIDALPTTSTSSTASRDIWKRYRLVTILGSVVLLFTMGLIYLTQFRKQSLSQRPEIRSLAVLPLENLSGDAGQDYFADGMTEELIASLSKIGNLRVISRTSVMQYKKPKQTLKEIARELGVDAVVEGSVLRSGDRIRITVQLIHGETDQHLWAESYQRDLRDILALQSEVGKAIANEIKITLSPLEQGLFGNARSVNPAALEKYLQGRDYFNQGRNKSGREGQELLKTSIGHFEEATRIQSDYALAYAGTARANHWLASGGAPEFFQESKEAAMKALQIDETLAEAHGALGYVLMTFDRNWAESEKEFKRAIQLNPSYSEARHGYALYLSAMGRHEEAIREITLAQQLDPLTAPLRGNMGNILISARQYDRAIEQFQRLRDSAPNSPEVHGVLGRAHVFKGKYEEGIAELKKQSELSGLNASKNLLLAWAYAVSGHRSEAIKVIEERMKDPNDARTVSKVNLAAVHTALGDHVQAFVWLEKAWEEGSLQLIFINVNPAFDNLRSDPRYGELMRRIGLVR